MADMQPTSDQNDNEKWNTIPGTGGFYEASDQGRIRSIDRVVVKSDNRTYRLRGRVLKPSKMSSGHLRVNIKIEGKPFEPLIHRLVMAAFVGPCSDDMEVCHNNGDPADNRLDNLRYGTRSDNLYDASKHGAHWQKMKDKCPLGHSLVEPNLVPSRFSHGGRRGCLACSRARPYARYHGILDEIQSVSDRYYEEIMRGYETPAA